MIWECPGVADFWKVVKENLFTISDIPVPLSPSVLILNDFSQLQLQNAQECVFGWSDSC